MLRACAVVQVPSGTSPAPACCNLWPCPCFLGCSLFWGDDAQVPRQEQIALTAGCVVAPLLVALPWPTEAEKVRVLGGVHQWRQGGVGGSGGGALRAGCCPCPPRL